MCGIAGVVGDHVDRPAEDVRCLVNALQHRGPDQTAVVAWPGGAIGAARLAMVDVEHGAQPFVGGGGRYAVAFNGEIYNHTEIRAELAAKGHVFRAACEVEVIVEAYREWGDKSFERFEGQFAIAVVDLDSSTTSLARDRWGICPLYFSTSRGGQLWFASESPPLREALGLAVDITAICELSEYWGLRPGHTLYHALDEVLPGEVVTWTAGVTVRRISRDPFDFLAESPTGKIDPDELAGALREAVSGCLQGDVPVGACVSGGLDSSLLAFLAAEQGVRDFFSIGFDDPAFDESAQQDRVVAGLPAAVRHHRTRISSEDLAVALPDAVACADSPLLRLTPVATLALSRMIREAGIKAVISGEGADELFLGYDLFKEVRLRSVWARHPTSTRLAPLARTLAGGRASRSYPILLRGHLHDDGGGGYGHELRSVQHRKRQSLFTRGFLEASDARSSPIHLPHVTDPVRRTQVVEMSHFLSGYLLSSQGDRPFMRNSVEARFPYLTTAVATIAGRIPTRLGARFPDEKLALRRVAAKILPAELAHRPKFAYRAPAAAPLQSRTGLELLEAYCNSNLVADIGVFDSTAVAHLRQRMVDPERFTQADAMSLVFILTTQLWLSQQRILTGRVS